MCELLHVRLMQLRGVFLTCCEKTFLLQCAHVCICEYTHVHGCIAFSHRANTHVLVADREGTFSRLVEAGGRLGLKSGCSLPTFTRVRKGENQSFEVNGFHCFPCVCFPATPFCQYLCTTSALGYGCWSPLSVGSKFSAAVFYLAWQVHLCSLWQGDVPLREGRGAFWLDWCHWKH